MALTYFLFHVIGGSVVDSVKTANRAASRRILSFFDSEFKFVRVAYACEKAVVVDFGV